MDVVKSMCLNVGLLRKMISFATSNQLELTLKL